MSLTTNPGFDQAAGAAAYGVAALVEAQARSGTIRVTSWPVNLTVMGQNWIGVGSLGKVGELRESDDGASELISVELSAVDLGLRGLALDPNDYVDRPLRIWIAMLNAETGQLSGAPILRFAGVMDRAQILPEAGKARIVMECRSAAYDVRSNPAALRMNNAQHQVDHPGELGFVYLNDMIGKPTLWLGVWTQAWIRFRQYLKGG